LNKNLNLLIVTYKHFTNSEKLPTGEKIFLYLFILLLPDLLLCFYYHYYY